MKKLFFSIIVVLAAGPVSAALKTAATGNVVWHSSAAASNTAFAAYSSGAITTSADSIVIPSGSNVQIQNGIVICGALFIQSGGSITFQSSSGRSITVTGGNGNSGTVRIDGSITMNNSSNCFIQYNGPSFTIASGATWAFGGNSSGTDGGIRYNGTTGSTLFGNGKTIGPLRVTAAGGTITLSGNVDLRGQGTVGPCVTLSTSTSNLIVPTGFTLTLSANNAITEDFAIISGGKITLNGTAILDNKAGTTGTIAGAGAITLNGTSKYIHNHADNVLVGSGGTTVSYAAGTTCEIKGAFVNNATLSGLTSQTFQNLTWNSAQLGNVILGGTSFNVAGTFDVQSTGNVAGRSLILTSNTGGQVVNITGDLKVSGLNGITILNLTNSSGNPTVNVTGNVSIGGNSFSSTLTSTGGASTLKLKGTWTNGTNGVFTNANTTIEFNSTTANQSITRTGGETFNVLNINNTFGGTGVTLASNVTAATLTLTAGRVTTGSNSITVSTSNGGLTTGGNTNYVNGNLIRTVGANAGSIAFHVGDASKYAPVTLSLTTNNSGTITGRTALNGGAPPVASNLNQSNYINRNWTLIFSAAAGSYTATMQYNTAVISDVVGSPNLNALSVGKITSAVWANPTGTSSSVSSSAITSSTSNASASTSTFYLGVIPTLTPVTLGSALTNTYSTASTGVSFTASGTNLTSTITATPQAGYQVSNNSTNGSDGTFTSSAIIGIANNAAVWVRNAANKPAGTTNNATAVVLSSTGAPGNANVTTSGSGNTVFQRAVVITPNSGQNKNFGAANPTYTYTNAPALVSPDVFSGAIGRTAGEAVGTYPYNLGSLTAGSNYSLSLGGSEMFTIIGISQNIADFRSQANGLFSSTSTWEFDQGGGSWLPAGQAPGSGNNITITHNDTLDMNLTVGATKTLTLNGSGALTVNPTRTLTVTGIADFGGKLVTFRSAGVGVGSLGQVASPVNTHLVNATNVTVERFIPDNGFRSWRLLSVPTFGSGQTIRQAWQDNGSSTVTPTGFGTQITSTGALATAQAAGFDNTSTTAALLTWNGTGWSAVSGTNSPIANNKAYFLFIRGDRSKGITGATTNTNATTLRTNGTIYTGEQVSPSIPASSFGLVPNLYPSAINFTTLTRSSSVSNLFYIWDSKKLNGTSLGAYQTFSATNGFLTTLSGGSYGTAGVNSNTTIESGQAFLVTTNNTGAGTITLHESSKIGGTNGSLGFRPVTPAGALIKIDSRLISNSDVADANVVVFDNVYANAVDGDDALKLTNPGENFAILRDTRSLAIEGRQSASVSDIIPFRIWNLRQQAYQLEFVPSNMSASGLTAELEDAYLHTGTPVSLDITNRVDFTVDANAASSASDRFRLVFRPAAPVPVNFISISANRRGAAVTVDWKVAAETAVRSYAVERSTNGRTFSTVGTVTATGNSSAELSYNFTDAGAPATTVYYRVKMISTAGELKYTSIVKVMPGDVKPGFAISPNPVEGGIVNLQFSNQSEGRYTVRLLSNAGQAIFTSVTEHAGGNSTQVLNLPSSIARGNYQVEIIAPDKTRTVQTLIVNKD